MKRVIRWQADNGTLHERRADAAAVDRALRKAKAEAVKSFLLVCRREDWIGHISRLPAGAWTDAGLVLYAYNTTVASVEKAVAKAVGRCRSLRERTGADWRLDEDMQLRGPAGETTQYIGRHPLACDLIG